MTVPSCNVDCVWYTTSTCENSRSFPIEEIERTVPFKPEPRPDAIVLEQLNCAFVEINEAMKIKRNMLFILVGKKKKTKIMNSKKKKNVQKKLLFAFKRKNGKKKRM